KFFRGPIVDLCAAILCSLVDSIFYHEPERIGYLAVCDDYDVRLLLGKACNRKQQAPENGESRNEFCLHFRWLLFLGVGTDLDRFRNWLTVLRRRFHVLNLEPNATLCECVGKLRRHSKI